MVYPIQDVVFSNPPVAEVALSLQTPPISRLTSAHIGQFWSSVLKKDYPATQDHPFVAPVIEQFVGLDMSMTFQFGMPGRHWLLSNDQTRLVQLQNDRLVLNWRRLDSEIYPSYSQLRIELERVAKLWRTFLVGENLPEVPINQAEITYINHVRSADVAAAGGPILSSLSVDWPVEIGTPEGLQFQQTFRTDDAAGRPARTYVSLAPVILADGTAGQALSLVIRGAPASGSLNDSLIWLDFGHNQIVNTFRDIIGPKLRRTWGA